jgi:aspartyl-tRNA(Asn)/glutamyl-tRNA(Gln) amidotransferase subunit C
MPGTEEKLALNSHPTAPGVTRNEVRHVAALASLELTPEEEERMERDLNAILGYVAELNQLDTSHVQPLSQISEILSGSIPSGEGLRADQPRPSLPRAIIMADAPATDGIFFKVPKVIER